MHEGTMLRTLCGFAKPSLDLKDKLSKVAVDVLEWDDRSVGKEPDGRRWKHMEKRWREMAERSDHSGDCRTTTPCERERRSKEEARKKAKVLTV